MTELRVKLGIVLPLILLLGGSKADSSDRGGGSSFPLSNFIDNMVSPFTDFVTNAVKQVTGSMRPIFPGTLWCGDGNKAARSNDLGMFFFTDNCCREHDECKENMKAGETLGPLTNDGSFTKSHCSCDRDFYQCLKNAHTPLSWKIGITYFTIVNPQCFALEHPVTKCTEYGLFMKRKCLKWEVDTTREKTLQWFDSPDFCKLTDYHNQVYDSRV